MASTVVFDDDEAEAEEEEEEEEGEESGRVPLVDEGAEKVRWSRLPAEGEAFLFIRDDAAAGAD